MQVPAQADVPQDHGDPVPSSPLIQLLSAPLLLCRSGFGFFEENFLKEDNTGTGS